MWWKDSITEKEIEKISKLMSAKYIGLSKIDGKPILLIENHSSFNFYKRWLNYSIVSSLDTNTLIIKIEQHDIDIFTKSLREEKLKRILYGK